MPKMIDLVGQKFHKLTVIERDYNYAKEHHLKRQRVYWKCQCDCGNFTTVLSDALRNGSTTQCLLCKSGNEIGKRYGRLTVLQAAEKNLKDGSSRWLCQCDCGNQVVVQAWHLRSGNTTSCGCYFREVIRNKKLIIPKISQQEQEVIKILEQNNISFLYDTPYFEDLRTANGGIARYDFILLNKENQPFRLIEIDGEQHFHPVRIFGGKLEFQKRMNTDKQKNEYALIHNIPLVRYLIHNYIK